jgi:hypothetical protein
MTCGSELIGSNLEGCDGVLASSGTEGKRKRRHQQQNHQTWAIELPHGSIHLSRENDQTEYPFWDS